MTDQDKLEEIYLVLSDLRYHLHKDDNTLENYQDICHQYWKRISQCAEYAGEMLPEEIVRSHDEP